MSPGGTRARTLLAALATLAACQQETLEPLPGIPAQPRGGGADGAGVIVGFARGQVRIEITAPAEMAVLKAGTAAEVRARISSVRPGTDEPSPDPIDAGALTWTLGSARGNVASGKLAGPVAPGEFAGRLDLGGAATGDHTLVVTAATRGGSRASASIPVRVDAGPRVVIVSPRDGVPYRGSVVAQVIVDAGPFEPLMGPIEAAIGSSPVALRPAAAASTHEATIEFARFAPPLDGEQVFRVAARNANGTRSEAQVRFVVDNRGPQFTATEPRPGAVVGGVITIRAVVQDVAGVVGSSVVAFIGNKTNVNFRVDLRPDGNAYVGLFDTRKLTTCARADNAPCIVWPNLSFRAVDGLGNEGVLAYDFAVDNQPPVLDLDPPSMRTVRFDEKLGRNVCSHLFDPVGNYRVPGDMPNDRCVVPQVFDLRARIEDAGNERAEGLKDVPVAGIDPESTTLYVLDDTSQALVVDSDGDGLCDELNPTLAPTTSPPMMPNQVLAVRLVGVSPRGAANYTKDDNADPACASGTEVMAPRPLCPSVDGRMTIAVGWPFASGPAPAIWSIEPVGGVGEAWCAGGQFDALANEIANGWACIAAQARDRAGNVSVSAPLRVWVQRQGVAQPRPNECPAPPANAGPPPDCTGRFNKQTSMPVAGRCDPVRHRAVFRYDQPNGAAGGGR